MADNLTIHQPAIENETHLPVITTHELAKVDLYSLILSAADIDHTIHRYPHNQWQILVAPDNYSKSRSELDAYEDENRNWPLEPPPADNFSPFFRVQHLIVVLSLMLFYSVTGPWSPHALWFIEGSINSSRIVAHGEYYRLLTALTLHSDLVHLLGNCFIGGFLLYFLFQLLGNGIGLFAVLLSATLANYINILAHGPGHVAVGFSTAVFSAIGILSALNYRHYKFTRPARLVLPLMAGATMLAMLGSGGERTDLGAHFFGLLTGLTIGTLLGIEKFFSLRHLVHLQIILSLVCLILPFLAWHTALY